MGEDMPFVKIPGMMGKLYVPKKLVIQKKKHPCRDCFACEFCSDDRCNVCRPDKEHVKKSGKK